jgi:hypothetical protein
MAKQSTLWRHRAERLIINTANNARRANDNLVVGTPRTRNP